MQAQISLCYVQADQGLHYPLTESMDTIVYVHKQRMLKSDCTDANVDLDPRYLLCKGLFHVLCIVVFLLQFLFILFVLFSLVCRSDFLCSVTGLSRVSPFLHHIYIIFVMKDNLEEIFAASNFYWI